MRVKKLKKPMMSLDKMSYLLVAGKRSSRFKGEASGDPPRAFWRSRGKMMKRWNEKLRKGKTGVGPFFKQGRELEETWGELFRQPTRADWGTGPQKKKKEKEKRWLGLGR